MALLFLNGFGQAQAKNAGGVGKTQEYECHQLHGKQLVVSEKVQHLAAHQWLMQPIQVRKAGFARLGQARGAARDFRYLDRGRAGWRELGGELRFNEFFFESRAKQNGSSELFQLHG